MRQLLAQHLPWREIQAILYQEFGTWRTRNAMRAKLNYNPSSAASMGLIESSRPMPEPSESAIEDMWRRRGLEPQSLTALVCGDPPIGYSMLDKMGARK